MPHSRLQTKTLVLLDLLLCIKLMIVHPETLPVISLLLLFCRYRALPSQKNATVRLTSGVSITSDLAEPVKDKWVLSLLRKDVHDKIVQVSDSKVYD